MTGLSNRLGPSPDRPRNSGRRGSLSSVHRGPRLADPDKFSGVSASQNHPRLCPRLPVKQQSRLVLSLPNDPVFFSVQAVTDRNRANLFLTMA